MTGEANGPPGPKAAAGCRGSRSATERLLPAPLQFLPYSVSSG